MLCWGDRQVARRVIDPSPTPESCCDGSLTRRLEFLHFRRLNGPTALLSFLVLFDPGALPQADMVRAFGAPIR